LASKGVKNIKLYSLMTHAEVPKEETIEGLLMRHVAA
jgi:hypothetical protein